MARAHVKPTGSAGYAQALNRLASSIANGRLAIFTGAGASVDAPANLPASELLLWEIAKRALVAGPSYTISGLAKRLRSNLRFEIFFQSLVDAIGESANGCLQVLEGTKVNANHQCIAQLSATSMVSVILTTNFDSLIEAALETSENHSYQVWHRPRDYRTARGTWRGTTLLKLHGTLRDRTRPKLKPSIGLALHDLGKSVDPDKLRVIRRVLKTKDLLFIGYSGNDDFDLLPLLMATSSRRHVFWVNHSGSSRPRCVTSATIRSKRLSQRSNAHRILASRRRGMLLNCRTSKVVADLRKKLGLPSTVAAPTIAQRRQFGYLDSWAASVKVEGWQAFVSGSVLRHLEEYECAQWYFRQVPKTSPLYLAARFYEGVCMRRGDRVPAARDLLNELAHTEVATRPLRSRAFVELGLLQIEQDQLTEGQASLQAAKELADGNLAVLLAVENNLGMSLLLQAERAHKAGDTRAVRIAASSAAKHLHAARRMAFRHGSPNAQANASGNLGLARMFMKQFPAARSDFEEALRLFRAIQLSSEEASGLENLASSYKHQALHVGVRSRQGRRLLEEALGLNRRAHRMKLATSTRRRIAFSKHEIGEVWTLLGNRRNAARWLIASRELLTSLGLDRYAQEVQKALDSLSPAKRAPSSQLAKQIDPTSRTSGL